ncbi:MAG: dTDP-4-dehydrorhamnose reductase [Fibrobacter sp.]|nr:dTDP-4-dehydrorhamnose reductase [Fibrobacter sp.]
MGKKILIIGSNGQLGSDMVEQSRISGYEVVGYDFPEIDITSKAKTVSIVTNVQPDIIINCSAFTAVDDCEKKTKEAFAVNATGPQNLAFAAQETDSLLVHISTDYVFDGEKDGAYTENDTPNPKTVYGKSKLEGEQAIESIWFKNQIFRIAWLYGTKGNNFVKAIRNVAAAKSKQNETLKVVSDQFGTPTYTVEVCRQVLNTITRPLYGVFHSTCEGSCSWYDFASAIVNAANIRIDLKPCTTEEFPRPAPRPHNSILENSRLKEYKLNIMSSWEDAFRKFLDEENLRLTK